MLNIFAHQMRVCLGNCRVFFDPLLCQLKFPHVSRACFP
jgi:hypothetical protein